MLFLENGLDVVSIYEVAVIFMPLLESDGSLSIGHQVSIVKDFGACRRPHEKLSQLHLKILLF